MFPCFISPPSVALGQKPVHVTWCPSVGYYHSKEGTWRHTSRVSPTLLFHVNHSVFHGRFGKGENTLKWRANLFLGNLITCKSCCPLAFFIIVMVDDLFGQWGVVQGESLFNMVMFSAWLNLIYVADAKSSMPSINSENSQLMLRKILRFSYTQPLF